ncbi:MAG: FKBP-type peptidyl-prolyl cis-trans isomerase [Gammaproteobacteria bacterium]|nr:FKBP-type peptidyl-prolyl cis-trans isomerase [Gammaproteobacteria bacterium]
MAAIDSLTIGSGTHVTIHFTLSLTDGTVVDSTIDVDPLSFDIGDGSLSECLEQVLIGMKAGEKQTVLLEAREAFGYPDDENIHAMERAEFTDDIELQIGNIVGFSMPSGEEIPGTIHEVREDKVMVDFNHPLAGRDIIFDVEVLEIKPVAMH